MSNFKDFQNRVCSLLKSKSKDIYFSQLRDGYSAAYKPAYPAYTKSDFVINTIDESGAYLRGNYELIMFIGTKIQSLYFWDLEDAIMFLEVK